jgi:beta-barrel assembly-enhancing protease
MSGMLTSLRWTLVPCLATALLGCSPEFQKIGGQILGQTGIITASQGEKVLGAGAKAFEPQEDYTPSNEYYLGRSVAAQILSRYPLSSDAALRRYVTKVGLILAKNSDLPETFGGYRFFVLDTNEVNALAAPGGFIFVSKGLIKALPDEDALAAVLAHEVAHVVKRHGIEAISSATRTASLGALGQVAAEIGMSQVNAPVASLSTVTQNLTAATGEIVETLVVNGYSREDEYDADAYAVELLGRAKYNPASLKVVLESLERARATAGGGGWFSTHPSPEDRLEELDDANAPVEPSPSQAVRAARFKKFAG